MNLFRLDASIFPATSASAELASVAEAEWSAAHPGATVTRRHIGTEPLPADAWALATTAGFNPEAERSQAQNDAVALAAALVSELRGADAVILAVPFYNFGVSQHFKAWVDLVIAGAGPTDPLLKGKPTALITTLGGGYSPGTPRDGWDHSTSYLERIVRDVWQADLTLIKRELTLAASVPAMEPLRDLAAQHHTTAKGQAREAGLALAGN
ncbi:NAD(P)H-dependent oxidoreductase [Actinospica durhamensis]|uniref:NAD(P)H-dependent oxidoreductase n=1 Tax=Actinospica durhamensis TaxID=1508375 RepID=A0A941IQV3_9ACTN|nr:NAD(P)H-dependent oxidoreductase [Actinospica durhamensis]MBR7833293.1 NAD(P)H-dependent oxidoreductase [Actinospica durhamensis]